MKFLLLPGDERELVAWLCGGVGLLLLLSDVLVDGHPAVAGDPVSAVPESLPEQAQPLLGRGIYTLTFWRPEWGVNRWQPPRSPDRRDDIADLLTRRSAVKAGVSPDTVIDPSRTPLLRLRRCVRHDDGWLFTGGIAGMALLSRLQPSEILRLHGKTERWLRRQAVPLVPELAAGGQALTRSTSPVYALPQAAAWIRDGGTFRV